jgi:multicomponent Na+:H+ antiporter subunit G
MIDWLIIIFSTLGTVFILLAAIGLLKMPDFYLRVSISTKAITLGTGLVLIATAISFNEFSITSRVIAIIIFIILTAPVAAHMIGRAAYFTKVPMWPKTMVNDISGQYDRYRHTLKGVNPIEPEKDSSEKSSDH